MFLKIVLAFAINSIALTTYSQDLKPQNLVSPPVEGPSVDDKDFYSGVPKTLKSKKFIDKVTNELGRLDLKFSLDFLNISSTGFNASPLGYKYGYAPSFLDNYYSRFDAYPGHISINPLEWLSEDTQFAFKLSASAELQFVRQFQNREEAWTAMPYSPGKAPINSKRALKNLNLGDYAGIIYNVSAFTGLDGDWSGAIRSQAQIGHTLSTQYGAQIFKLKDNHIRFRLFAERSNGPGYSFGGKAHKDDFDLFGAEFLNDSLRRLIKPDLYNISGSRKKRQAFLADFVLNLNDLETQKAFDLIMDKVISLNEGKFRILNPFISEQEIINYLLTFTSPLEDLFQEDQQKNSQYSRVIRIFFGKDIIPVSSHQGFRFGNALFTYKNSKDYFENKLTYLARDNQIHRHTLADFESLSGFRALFSLFREETKRSANTLFKRDENNKLSEILDIGFLYEFKDKSLSKKEMKKIKNGLCGILDGEACQQIDWSPYLNKDTENFRLRVQYIFTPKAYSEIAKVKNYYPSLIKTLMKQTPETLADVTPSNQRDCDAGTQCDLIQLHMSSIEGILKNLYLTFHHEDPGVAFKAFSELQYNPLFMAIGGRILMDLIPDNVRPEVTATIIEASGANRDPINQIFISEKSNELKEQILERQNLYQYVKSIQTSIFNKGFDLRLIGIYGDLSHLNP